MVLPGKSWKSHGIFLEQKSHGKVMIFIFFKVLMSRHYFYSVKVHKLKKIAVVMIARMPCTSKFQYFALLLQICYTRNYVSSRGSQIIL